MGRHQRRLNDVGHGRRTIGILENGTKTDRVNQQRQMADTLRNFLSRWEKEHPRATPVPPTRALSQEEIDQLKAIGYLN